MTAFTVSLAGIPIRIHAICPGLKEQFWDYLCTEEPAFEVAAERTDIVQERQAVEKSCGTGPSSEVFYEILAVSRRIADRMPDYDTIQFYGSVVAVDGKAYLFAAPSGTGKTTHALLWLKELPQAHILTDDKPFLKIDPEGGVWAFGVPWRGKEHLGRNEMLPLEAICLLERATENTIQPITPQEAAIPVMRYAYLPEDPAGRLKSIRLLDSICRGVRLYRMGCTPDPSAARLSMRVLLGKDSLINPGEAGDAEGFEHG